MWIIFPSPKSPSVTSSTRGAKRLRHSRPFVGHRYGLLQDVAPCNVEFRHQLEPGDKRMWKTQAFPRKIIKQKGRVAAKSTELLREFGRSWGQSEQVMGFSRQDVTNSQPGHAGGSCAARRRIVHHSITIATLW